MSQRSQDPVVPVSLERLAGFSTTCDCGRVHAIDTQRFVIRRGALDDVTDCARELVEGGSVGIAVDQRTHQVAGRSVHELMKSAGYNVTLCVVPDTAGGRPHATFEAVLEVQRQLQFTDFIVAVGSGTINDLAKLASYRLGIPYMVVATAPSMNGYTSAIAAIMKDGLKCTVDCHQPIAVIADLDVLCHAPMFLIRAGLGDLESKPVSTADFKLSALLRGSWYCPEPGRVVATAEKRAAACAKQLGEGDAEAVAVLTEALLLSGCSMKLAGSSSPASGGEHLISHYWDMTADAENREEGFHGAQVGVATIVTASLYEYLQTLTPLDFDIGALVRHRPTAEEARESVLRHHGAFGALAVAEFEQKRLSDAAYLAELEYVVSHWAEIWKTLSMLKPASEIRSTLHAAGCPVTVEELELTAGHLRRAFLYSREIRGRFTVLDFAADLGVLDDAVDFVFANSGCVLEKERK